MQHAKPTENRSCEAARWYSRRTLGVGGRGGGEEEREERGGQQRPSGERHSVTHQARVPDQTRWVSRDLRARVCARAGLKNV